MENYGKWTFLDISTSRETKKKKLQSPLSTERRKRNGELESSKNIDEFAEGLISQQQCKPQKSLSTVFYDEKRDRNSSRGTRVREGERLGARIC